MQRGLERHKSGERAHLEAEVPISDPQRHTGALPDQLPALRLHGLGAEDVLCVTGDQKRSLSLERHARIPETRIPLMMRLLMTKLERYQMQIVLLLLLCVCVCVLVVVVVLRGVFVQCVQPTC